MNKINVMTYDQMALPYTPKCRTLTFSKCYQLIESNSINMDTEGAIERIHINEVSVLSGLNLEKI